MEYKAPRPSYPWLEWFKFVGARLIFPPVLIWDGLKLGSNAALGKFIGTKVLPAQSMGTEDNPDFDCEGLEAEQHTIITHDNASLETFEIRNLKEKKKDIKQQKFIINFNGNAMCYQTEIDQMKADALRLQCHVVGFNYRGVGKSTKNVESANDLVIDGIAQVQRLIDSGVDPENITLNAHSLGAGIGALVTKHFHDNGQKINLFHSRSFSNITNEVVGHIRLLGNRTGQETIGRKILGWMAAPFIKLTLVLTKWEMNVVDAYREIPRTHKEYLVVRSSKARRKNEYVIDDSVIPHYASLHNALKDERHEIKRRIAAAAVELRGDDALLQPKQAKALNALVDMRNAMKQRKMQVMEDSDIQEGHVIPLTHLKNRYDNKTGQDFFDAFFKRAHKHHQKLKNQQEKEEQTIIEYPEERNSIEISS